MTLQEKISKAKKDDDYEKIVNTITNEEFIEGLKIFTKDEERKKIKYISTYIEYLEKTNQGTIQLANNIDNIHYTDFLCIIEHITDRYTFIINYLNNNKSPIKREYALISLSLVEQNTNLEKICKVYQNYLNTFHKYNFNYENICLLVNNLGKMNFNIENSKIIELLKLPKEKLETILSLIKPDNTISLATIQEIITTTNNYFHEKDFLKTSPIYHFQKTIYNHNNLLEQQKELLETAKNTFNYEFIKKFKEYLLQLEDKSESYAEELEIAKIRVSLDMNLKECRKENIIEYLYNNQSNFYNSIILNEMCRYYLNVRFNIYYDDNSFYNYLTYLYQTSNSFQKHFYLKDHSRYLNAASLYPSTKEYSYVQSFFNQNIEPNIIGYKLLESLDINQVLNNPSEYQKTFKKFEFIRKSNIAKVPYLLEYLQSKGLKDLEEYIKYLDSNCRKNINGEIIINRRKK